MIYKKISWLKISLIGLLLVSNPFYAKLDINFEDAQEQHVPLSRSTENNAENIVTQTDLTQPSDVAQTTTNQSPHELLELKPANPPAPQEVRTEIKELQPQLVPKKTKRREKEKLISFNFKDEPLTNIINLFAAKRGINIVLPQGENAIKTTITLDQKEKISLAQAEKYLYSFLDLVGYGVYPNSDFFVIAKKTENNVGREPVTLYVNVPPDELPKSTEPIRAIYYLSNFQVPKNPSEDVTLNRILNDMVGPKRFLFDEKSNGIILSANADKIASAMTIILSLDATGASETIEVFPLFYADAAITAKLLQEQVIAMTGKQAGGRVQTKGESGVYFAPNTMVKADPRTNSLILIGTESAVTRIKSFVREYIDAPLESGRSILHVYELQYLDAVDFAKVLESIVKQSTGQSAKEPGGGAQRFFEDVIIVAETKDEAVGKEVGGSAAAAKGKVALGGNRLLISAKHDDWLMIKHLIEKLDKPELQVIIEIMILDISLDGTKILNAQTRNPISLPLYDNIQFQTANITNQIPGVAPGGNASDPQISLTADLLELLGNPSTDQNTTSMAVPASSNANVGSMIISFKDPCQDAIWSVLQILDRWTTSNVISHPFIVTKNNIKGRELLIDTRRDFGRDVASGGVTTTKVEDFDAKVSVEVTPRISSLNRLNMQIKVDVQNFTSTDIQDFTRTTRGVETNATMSAGQVLIIGGLVREEDSEVIRKFPILGDIPIIGAWFRGTAKTKTKNNLAIIIHPTIVNPKLRAGQQRHTKQKIDEERATVSATGLFSSVKDPVTRLFFGDMGDGIEALDDYLKEAHYLRDADPEHQEVRATEQKAFDASFDPNFNDLALPKETNIVAAA